MHSKGGRGGGGGGMAYQKSSHRKPLMQKWGGPWGREGAVHTVISLTA